MTTSTTVGSRCNYSSKHEGRPQEPGGAVRRGKGEQQGQVTGMAVGGTPGTPRPQGMAHVYHKGPSLVGLVRSFTVSPPQFIPFAALSGTLSGQPPLLPSWVNSGEDTDGPSSGRQPSGAPSRPATPPPSGSQGTQRDPPLPLPNTGLLAIPAPLVRRIWEGAFVDMGDLLPEALQWAFDRSLEEKGEKEKRKKFPIDSVSDWALSFATYMAIRVLTCPSLAAPLATYMAIILRLAHEVPGLAWQRYDRMFCQAVAGNPELPWDRREPDIWLSAIAEQPRPSQAVPSPRTGPKPPSSSMEMFLPWGLPRWARLPLPPCLWDLPVKSSSGLRLPVGTPAGESLCPVHGGN